MGGQNTAEKQCGETVGESESPLGRFVTIANLLGLDPGLQSSLLGCRIGWNVADPREWPERQLGSSMVIRLGLLNEGYQHILQVTQDPNEILDILFSPQGEAPFFGVPPIRFLQGTGITSLSRAVDYFRSSRFQNSRERRRKWLPHQ